MKTSLFIQRYVVKTSLILALLVNPIAFAYTISIPAVRMPAEIKLCDATIQGFAKDQIEYDNATTEDEIENSKAEIELQYACVLN